MTFRHGKDTIALIGPYDLSPWLNEVGSSTSVETADTSHFGTQAKTYITGADEGSFSFSGLFDGDKTELEDKITALTAAGAVLGWPVTIANDGGATLGRRVRYGRARRTGWEISSPFSDVVKVSGGLQADGGVRSGVLLNSLAPFSATFSGTSVDQVAATPRGALVGFHVIENNVSGAVTLRVQHSTDGSVWVDLATHVTTANTISTVEVETSGTVNRYLRFQATVSGTGSIRATASAARK